MNARRASRELALFSLLQLARLSVPKFQTADKTSAALAPKLADPRMVRDTLMATVRALVSEAKDKVETAADDLADVSRYFLTMEQEDPTNLATAFDAEVKPVPIPTTREMVEKIEQLLLAAEYLAEAFRIPELATHSQAQPVQEYATRLVQLVQQNETELDFLINHYAEDWRLDRLVKLDAMILRLAAAEMIHLHEVDLSVSINEAVELAKLFSTHESHRFINGILGRIATAIEEKTLPDRKQTQLAAAEEEANQTALATSDEEPRYSAAEETPQETVPFV